MKTTRIIFLVITFISVFSCSTTNKSRIVEWISYDEVSYLIENAPLRKNFPDYKKLLEKLDSINDYSVEIIEELNKSGYQEVDINKMFGIEIEKKFYNKVLQREWEFFGTKPIVCKINNIKYTAKYVIDCDDDFPNIYTLVFVYSDEKRESIQVHCKINCNLEYFIINDQKSHKSFNVFF